MKWISLKNGIPPNGQFIFAYCKYNFTSTKYLAGKWSTEDNCLITDSECKYAITHWLSPEPPKGEE